MKCGLAALQAMLLASVALPVAAQQQRVSESLVDCAALAAVPTSATPGESGSEDDRAAAMLSDAFRDAAIREAGAEGRQDPEGFVGQMLIVKRAAWLDRGPSLSRGEEFRDRTAACRAVGRDRGVPVGQ